MCLQTDPRSKITEVKAYVSHFIPLFRADSDSDSQRVLRPSLGHLTAAFLRPDLKRKKEKKKSLARLLNSQRNNSPYFIPPPFFLNLSSVESSAQQR